MPLFLYFFVLSSCCLRQGFCLFLNFLLNLPSHTGPVSACACVCLAKWLSPICSIFTYRPLCVCALDPSTAISISICRVQRRLSLFWWSCMHKHVAGRQLRWQATMRQLSGATFRHVASRLLSRTLSWFLALPHAFLAFLFLFISSLWGQANWLRLMGVARLVGSSISLSVAASKPNKANIYKMVCFGN